MIFLLATAALAADDCVPNKFNGSSILFGQVYRSPPHAHAAPVLGRHRMQPYLATHPFQPCTLGTGLTSPLSLPH